MKNPNFSRFALLSKQFLNRFRRGLGRDVEVRQFSDHMKKDIGWYNVDGGHEHDPKSPDPIGGDPFRIPR